MEEESLGMNVNMGSSKVMSSLYYSHTYKLVYSYCVMILIYELVQSLCVMRVAHLTLCLNNHESALDTLVQRRPPFDLDLSEAA